MNQDRTDALLGAYESLAEAPHPYLKRTTAQALALCRSRLRLALADEQYGNTPASSVREFQQAVVIPAVQYGLQRDADCAELRESLEREYPGYEVIVNDAPLSDGSRQKLGELLKGAGGMMEDVKKRALVSGLLAYADMAQVDRAATFWQTRLLPLARHCAGPATDKPLVEVEAGWRDKRDKQASFKRLDAFLLHNVSGQDLTGVVVELIAENEWGEKAAQYYYLPRLEMGDSARLMPHPRWEKRRLDFTNTINVTWSVWADQGRVVDRQEKLSSPQPNPDPAGWPRTTSHSTRSTRPRGKPWGR